jgi:hypothetical protein
MYNLSIINLIIYCYDRDLDGRQMVVGGFLNILNDQLNEIKNGENDGQAVAAEGVAFEILGKRWI